MQARVSRIRREAAGILSFELVAADGAALPAADPGAHIDVHLGPGLVRQYSLCNASAQPQHYLIAVKREPDSRGGSAALHERVREGELLEISAPRNNFPLQAQARHHVLLAGGIGVTPLLSMALHLQGLGRSFELHYFTRSAEHTAFRELLGAPQFAGKATLRYGLEPEGLRACLAGLLGARPAGAHLYLCGPRPFMDMVQALAAPAWPPEAVHLEYFAADPMSLAGPRPRFRVRLARSGGEYEVGEGETITAALAAHGVHIETSCEQGVCGTCLTRVLEGVPEHRDIYLNEQEKRAGDSIIPCVSRARSEVLVLDL